MVLWNKMENLNLVSEYKYDFKDPEIYTEKFPKVLNVEIIKKLSLIKKDPEWVKREISERVDFKDRFLKVKNKITSEQFKDNLQGVYGYIDKKLFEKHKKMVLELWKV